VEIKVMKNIMDSNNKVANANKALFREKHISAINIMASPGAGKTSIIVKMIEMLGNELKFSVIEGDIASSIDAQKIHSMGIPVVQINTGGGCHLDANMIHTVATGQTDFDNSVLFIENVGNLVCPSSFNLGENAKMVIASVPEGHDKPYKYTSMFEAAHVIVLNKIDLIPYIDFDRQYFYRGISAINSKAPVFEVSCSTGEGLDRLAEWIRQKALIQT
jgi:hydrogenase nickel incorporation protein HypB